MTRRRGSSSPSVRVSHLDQCVVSMLGVFGISSGGTKSDIPHGEFARPFKNVEACSLKWESPVTLSNSFSQYFRCVCVHQPRAVPGVPS